MSNPTVYDEAKQFAMQSGKSLIKYNSSEFFDKVHADYYSEYETSFKDYFRELLTLKGQFVVEHTKLIELGVMSSKRSNDVANKLKSIGMRESEHYRVRDIPQQDLTHGGSNKKVYMLTPDAILKCLLRAKPYPGQIVNPEIYGDSIASVSLFS